MATWKKVITDGADLSDIGTPASDDKLLIQDTSDSNTVKYVDWADVGGGGGAVATYTNGVDNRVLTSSGADSINGEVNMTFSGSTLVVTGKSNFSDTVRVTTNNKGFAGTNSSSGIVSIASVNTSDQVEIGSSSNGLLLNSDGGPRIVGNDNYLTGQTTGGTYSQVIGVSSNDDVLIGRESLLNKIYLANPLQAVKGVELETTSGTTAASYGTGAEITYLGSSATGVNAGRIYYYTGSTWSAFSSATEAAQKALLGIALGSTMNDGFLLKGFVRPNATGSFTAGTLVYGATNASAVTSAPTSGFQRIMGHSVSTAVMFFNPSVEYIDLA